MRLEYNLFNCTDSKERVEDLKSELEPRNQCRGYVTKNGGVAVLITLREFKEYCRKNQFSKEGPLRDSFGDGYGHPYSPFRQAFGRLKSGEIVYCELSDD